MGGLHFVTVGAYRQGGLDSHRKDKYFNQCSRSNHIDSRSRRNVESALTRGPYWFEQEMYNHKAELAGILSGSRLPTN